MTRDRAARPLWLFHRRAVVAGSLAIAGADLLGLGSASGQPQNAITPEMFGAKGDGVSNDSAAFASLAAYINARGGGTVQFRRTTYIVGSQRRNAEKPGWAFDPVPLLAFEGCTAPLILQGNGARIRCADGLRFGRFGATSGEAMPAEAPREKRGGLASPYREMILVANCTGPVEIADLELDGNVAGLRIGGRSGDKGRQIFAIGLSLRENRGSECVRNVYSHHHALDGVYIVGIEERLPGVVRRLDNVRAEYNARQGCSLLAGQDYFFADCVFSHSGKAGLMSPPGAGFDIEPRSERTARRLRFERCVFADNSGVGLVADRGNTADVAFDHCRFVGTTNWGVWPKKRGFIFRDCLFVGAIVRCFPSEDATQATRFDRCTFSDDPGLSPTGKIFLHGPTGPIADLATGTNVRFDKCSFLLGHSGVLPWSRAAIYVDCTMRQTSRRKAYPRGSFIGRNTIVGNVDIARSAVSGSLTINGRVIAEHTALSPTATPASKGGSAP